MSYDASFDYVWRCPKCGGDNIDNYQLTAEPMCEHCDHEFSWSQIMPASEQNRLNALWEALESPVA